MLADEQWLDTEQLQRRQVERLKQLISHAATASPFYRQRLAHYHDKINSLSSLQDLADFPLLTRQQLQEHYRELLCPLDDTVYSDSSGGSTGQPVNFYHDAYYKMFGNAIHHLFLSWLGVSPGDRTAVFWGADRDFRSLSLKDKVMMKLERVRSLNSFNVDQSTLKRFLDELAKFRPTYVYGYASSLALAARWLSVRVEGTAKVPEAERLRFCFGNVEGPLAWLEDNWPTVADRLS